MRMVVGLSLALALLTSCASRPRQGASLDASLEHLIPGDTVVLVQARMDELQKTAVYKRLLQDQKLGQLEEFSRQTGLDPRRDIHQLVIAWNGKQDALVIARGVIKDKAHLEKLMQDRGARREQYDKYTLLADSGNSVVFVDNSLALAGRTERLKLVLSGNTGDDTAKKALLARISTVPPDSHIWAITVGGFSPMPLPERGNLGNVNRLFQSVETSTVSLDLAKGINLAATGDCVDDKSARQIHDAIRGLIGFGRLSTRADDPETLRFFDTIKVDHDKKRVKVEADVPMDLIEHLLTLGKKRPAA